MNYVIDATSEDSRIWPSVGMPDDLTDQAVFHLRPYDAATKSTYDNMDRWDSTQGVLRKLEMTPVAAVRRLVPAVDSLPIQIWEGTVTEVDWEEKTFDATLEAKRVIVPRHMATFSFDWIAEQDIALIVPGAVFYLSLYKESLRSSVRNTQEIRFRRLPAWSKAQVTRIERDVELFSSHIEGPPSGP